MNFFKSFPVAVAICAAVIFLCCLWGFEQVYVPPEEPEDSASESHSRAGESNLNYYLSWMEDEAGMFNMDTADTIARKNLSLDSEFNSLVAIRTVSSLEGVGIDQYARSLSETMDLGGRDMLLVLDAETQDWYVVYGPGLQPYVEMNTELQELFEAQLSPDFFAVTSNRRVVLLFDALTEWFEANVPPVDETENASQSIQHATFRDVFLGIVFTLMTNIWWILILVVALTLLDRTRCRNYVLAHPDGHDRSDPFHPLLFWHHAGSRWYENMEELTIDDRYGEDDDDYPEEQEL